MRIRLLGTGTPTPSLRRMSSSYLVETGAHTLIFDHGSGAYHRLLEAGVSPTEVTHTFFSHLHYDHCIDYGRLLLTRWDQSGDRLPELKVYGPPGMARMNDLLFSRDGVWGPDLTARIDNEMSQEIFVARGGTLPRRWPEPEVREVRSGDTVTDGEWTVRVISVPHAQPQLVCLAYRLDTPQGSFAYSGDAAPSDAFAEFAAGVDVLVHMTHYISGTELGPALAKGTSGHLEVARIGAQAGAKNLVVSHITEQMDVPGVPERLIREMGELYGGNIFWGEDLMEIPVAPPTPAKLD